MEKLNYECLEHIFGFLNCGPREWLLLSRVCKKWQEVFLRFWKRITIIKISNEDPDYEYNPNVPYLSTQMVLEIVGYVAEYLEEISISKREKINNIVLGNSKGRTLYNLNGLNLGAVLEALKQCSAKKITKVKILPDLPILKSLMKLNTNLKNLTIILDKHCFIESGTMCTRYDLRSKEVDKNSAKERSAHRKHCAKICREVRFSIVIYVKVKKQMLKQ